jgi:hypothetical protein
VKLNMTDLFLGEDVDYDIYPQEVALQLAKRLAPVRTNSAISTV